MDINSPKVDELSFYIFQNEDKYKLDIKNTKEEAVFLSIKNENMLSLKYSIKLGLKDLIQTNKIFKIYDSISEFIESIKILIDKKLISIKESQDKNICILEMIFSDTSFGENKINLELIPEERNKDELIKDLMTTIKNFEKKFKNLETENEILKNKINEIQNSLDILQNKYNEESLLKWMDFPSKILNNKKELDLLIYPIQSKENKKVKNFKKLYCASIDGESATDFHKNCDGKFNTLVLIQTPDERRFGGFTHENWKSGSNYEPNTFLFSLDLLKIYPRKENGYSILFYSSTGPVFGGDNEIRLGDKCLSTKSFSIKNTSKNFDFYGIKNPFCNYKDDEKIQIIDYEVYEVIFE